MTASPRRSGRLILPGFAPALPSSRNVALKNRKQRGEGKPETFNLLGFTHICGRTRRTGRFIVKRKTIPKRLSAKLKELKEELRRRWHEPVDEIGRWLRSVVHGSFNYHAVPGNMDSLNSCPYRNKPCPFRCPICCRPCPNRPVSAALPVCIRLILGGASTRWHNGTCLLSTVTRNQPAHEPRVAPPAHRNDESPADYSSGSCSPAKLCLLGNPSALEEMVLGRSWTEPLN